ncbi:hypothetical protein ANCCAN_29408 [Ancylostoma caninum]|uniref:Uncharacterized protein n=1 Tax=Ancylostoma caninum TaxID=29170 RepID=A0A368EYM5_ANCCA|nr:hypothetical protein ANCCAN_29408 [Ancylostoma caninum]
MSGKVSSAADSHIASLCPVCQAVPMDKTAIRSILCILRGSTTHNLRPTPAM